MMAVLDALIRAGIQTPRAYLTDAQIRRVLAADDPAKPLRLDDGHKPRPVPECPRCHSVERVRRTGVLDQFRCGGCWLRFWGGGAA